jgi:hypothetical protein
VLRNCTIEGNAAAFGSGGGVFSEVSSIPAGSFEVLRIEEEIVTATKSG